MGQIKSFNDPEQTINVSASEEFLITISSDLGTGHLWQASYDENMLEVMISRELHGQGERQGVITPEGDQIFRFKALNKGQTQITMFFRRSWEEEPIDQKVFTVNIE